MGEAQRSEGVRHCLRLQRRHQHAEQTDVGADVDPGRHRQAIQCRPAEDFPYRLVPDCGARKRALRHRDRAGFLPAQYLRMPIPTP